MAKAGTFPLPAQCPKTTHGPAYRKKGYKLLLQHELQRIHGLILQEDHRVKVAVPLADGAVEATLSEPPLDTVQIPSSEIGRLAAYIMMNRIQVPDSPFRWTYVKTTPIVGGTIRR